MVNHSYRTWAFGHALAEVDNETLDCEIFFAAAMLHDVGLANPTYGRCFTDTGATAAARLGTTAEEREVTASAVRHHITPGLDASQGGLHGLYLQRGALLDLSGVRAFHLPVQFVKAVCERWPMLDGHVEASARWRAESALVKGGRAHHLQTRSRFSLVARCTPIPP